MRTISFVGDIELDGPQLYNDVMQFIAAHSPHTAVDFNRHKEQMCVVLGEDDEVHGVFASRPMVLVHEFLIDPGANSRLVAECMFNYAMGAAAVGGHTQGLIAIDKTNLPMLRFIRSKKPKVYSEGEDVIFLLDVE